jgi:hypothetical protein
VYVKHEKGIVMSKDKGRKEEKKKKKDTKTVAL